MQKIFYDCKIFTLDEKCPVGEAMLTNDESVVLVSSKEEIFSMKTEETELISLGGKTVFPSFFDVNANIYYLIENNIKNAKKDKFLENNDEIDENYDKFDNFEIYKKEFLKLQEDYLSKGITTIYEYGINAKRFTFFKKMAEANLLKIDILGFVDMISSKSVMDNNCRSYRKYKNHFRLGGYHIAIDGSLADKKAWLSKPYPHERGYKGYSFVTDEQLSFLIKNALDEKKQMVVQTNGDEAVNQFLRCFEENVKDKEKEDLFRPIAKNCTILSKSQLLKMKELNISPFFEIGDKENILSLKKTIGRSRFKQMFPINFCKDKDIKFMIISNQNQIESSFGLSKSTSEKNIEISKILNKKRLSGYAETFTDLIKNSAYFAFDENQKATLENGKQANFVVVQGMESLEDNQRNPKIISTYICGEKVK